MSDPSPKEFVRVLGPALRQAAAIARALEGRVVNRPKSGEIRAAKRALTSADTAAQEALLVPLVEHFPRVRLEAEEDTETVHRFAPEGRALVVVDPIDGTLHSYLGGEGPYAVMIGLAIEDVYEAALVALPREGLFFEAVRHGGAYVSVGGAPATPARVSPEGRAVIVSHEMPDAVVERLRERGREVIRGCGGAISVAPLIPGVAAGLRIATGDSGISRRGRIGALIASEAGALLRSETGEPFPAALYAPARALLVAKSREDFADLEYALEAAHIRV